MPTPSRLGYGFYYARIAAGHRAKAATADGDAERDHWALEAERFDELATLAAIDPKAARDRYRPTRAHQPGEADGF